MKSITINITAKTSYLPEQSLADQLRFMWSYEISIHNQSEETVQLLKG